MYVAGIYMYTYDYVLVQFYLGVMLFSFVSNWLSYITIPQNKGK